MKRRWTHKIHKRKLFKAAVIRRIPLSAHLFAFVFAMAILIAMFIVIHGGNHQDVPQNGGIAEVAETQVGNGDGGLYWEWYGFDEPVDWCACFVSWCADQCGHIKAGSFDKFSNCQDGVSQFASRGSWHRPGIRPRRGMVIFFDWDGDDEADHVGIVKRCKDGAVYTIEGNSGGRCRERRYPADSGAIYGYGAIGHS